MHVISHKALRTFIAQYPASEASLTSWYRLARKATWGNLVEAQQDWPSAEAVGACTVFNINGNHFRLIAKVYYDTQVLLVRAILTHSEYDKKRWMNDC